MISEFSFDSSEESLILKSDFAGHLPLYVYVSKNKKNIYWSESLTNLLDSASVVKPLSVSDEAISFLLLNSVVPPPLTVYENVFIISIGVEMHISKTESGHLFWNFEHKNNFHQALRGTESVDSDYILSLLYQGVDSRVDKDRESFVFHSAGKDSNPIALAIAEAGKQSDFTLVTYKSSAGFDESDISKKIAKQLGFKHEILHETISFSKKYLGLLLEYFTNAPFPCLDNVTLAYPGYAVQIPELMSSNIVDGMGNDIYIGHIPTEDEYLRQKLSSFLSLGKFLDGFVSSENKLHSLTRVRAEWVGLSGFSLKDAKAIYKQTLSTVNYWRNYSDIEDYFDFRSFVRGRIIDTEIYMRKVRNFTDAFGGNVVFPWADEKVARYILNINPKELYDKKEFRNKIFLREMMKRKINVDSDMLGKMGFSYSLHKLVKSNFEHMCKEISSCSIWNQEQVEVLRRIVSLKVAANDSGWNLSTILLYRLFIISSWYNYCRWLKG